MGIHITREGSPLSEEDVLLVEAMGGAVTMESAPERGSAFKFTLPLARKKDTTLSRDSGGCSEGCDPA